MRTLSSADFLDLWERGHRLHSLDQGLLVLSAALPEAPHDSLADWSLGRRNQALAELRYRCFGPDLQGWFACPQCGEKLEFQMDVRSMIRENAGAEQYPNEVVVVQGHSYRLPTSRDLACAAAETDASRAAARLLESCALNHDGRTNWSEDELEEVGEQMALADPLSEVRLAFDCPKCRNHWDESLDLVAFLWAEIEARARKLLLDVHTLASAYGWTEPEILSLSDRRRATYLEMVHA